MLPYPPRIPNTSMAEKIPGRLLRVLRVWEDILEIKIARK
jgi:hypothetical protein